MTERTADDAYRERLAGVRGNLHAISVAVDEHVLETGVAPHYGHVGDLAHLDEILIQARQYILQEEE